MGSTLSRSQNATRLQRGRKKKKQRFLGRKAGQIWRLVKRIRLLGLRRALLERRRAKVAAAASEEDLDSLRSQQRRRSSSASLGSTGSMGSSTSVFSEDLLADIVRAPAPGDEWGLIPGLPHDVAIQCLARVPRAEHCLMRAVCRSWRWIAGAPEFGEQRRLLGCAEDWLYLHVGTSPHLDERREVVMNSSSSLSGWKRGSGSNSNSSNKWQLVGGFSLWHALDPYRYEWRALPPIPYDEELTGGQVVLGATSVVMDGNLYVIGGAPFGKPAIRDVWVYNPLRNRWTPVAPMITPRFACLAATIRGKLYVIGGSGICHLTGYSLPCLEVYSPSTNSWSYRASARGIVTAHPCSPLKYVAVVDDKLCVIGPQNATGRINAGMYDPDTDTWLEIKPGLRAGWGKASTVMDGLLYTLDFGCYQQYVSDQDSWLPVKGKNADSLLEWDPRLVSAMAGSNGKLYMVGTMGPALIVVIAPVRGGRVNQNVCWHTMKLPDGVDFLGDLGHCSCQVISF